MKKTYHGSCHCGGVRFECDLDLDEGTRRCNCSFCLKSRYWKALAKSDSFRLLDGEKVMAAYQASSSLWPPGNVYHFFCGTCGVRPFSRGCLEEFGGDFHMVNIVCLDDATDEELARAPVQFEDGRRDCWNATPTETRHL
jgi:hypothetical protein